MTNRATREPAFLILTALAAGARLSGAGALADKTARMRSNAAVATRRPRALGLGAQ